MKRNSFIHPGLVLMLAACSGPFTGAAAEAPGALAADTTKSLIDRLSEPKLQAFGFVYLPKVSYGEYTGVGLGGQILRPFNWRDGSHASEVDVEGRATSKGQGEASFTMGLGWNDARYFAKTKLEFSNIAHRFYGLGPDTPEGAEEVFERQSLLYYIEFFRRVSTRLRVGVRGEFEDSKMIESEGGGLLETQAIPGAEASQVLGLGALADWDSRDDRYWPTRGSYHQAFALKFDDGLDSDYNFDVYYAELRQYLPTAKNHVLALQAFLYATDGSPPFWRLAELGGRHHSRGYQRGRYRDKVLLAFQGEHRFAVWRRLGLVGFVGLADVAPTLPDMKLEHMRPTVGGGVRFRVGSAAHRINARLDVAYGADVRLYFKLGESF